MSGVREPAGVFGAGDEAELVEAMHAATSLGWSGPPRVPPGPTPTEQRHGWRNPSVRRFIAPRPSDAELAAILGAGYGTLGNRPVPSAGGLYSLRLVVVDLGDDPPATRACDGWAPVEGDERVSLDGAFFGSVAGPCSVIVLAGSTAAPSARYGARAYRYLLLEAGHCAQELLRAAQAAGLGSCPLGAFDDSRLSRLLRLDWSGELPLYALAVGRAAGS